METISEYFSDKDRIKELEAELVESKRLMINERVYKNHYKRLYEDLKGEKIQTRKSKAILLIKELKNTGKPGNLIKAIAKKCNLSESRINDYWYEN